MLPLLGALSLSVSPQSGPPAPIAPATTAATSDGPVSQVVVASEDTYRATWATVSAAAVDSQVLVAGDEQADGRVSYLKFPVAALPSNAADVTVTLTLHQVDPSARGLVTAYRIVDAWAEGTLTAANAPGLAGPLGYGDAAGAGQATAIRVPASKVPWGGTVSFGLTAGLDGGGALSFASTHGTDSTLWPTLSISYDLSSAPTCTVSALLVPSCGAWFGSTTNQFGTESGPADSVARQEAELGRPLDIIHVYHSGSEDWPTSTELSLISDPTTARRLFVNWKPEAGSTWADVAAGTNDNLIDTVAARIEARLGNRPFFLTLHHEPEQEVQGDGSGFSQSDYAAMFRHVVERLRLDGVTNAVMVWNMMGFSGWGDQGYYDAMYPGDDVVDWIGYDPYSHDGAQLTTFADRQGRVFPGFYSWATLVHPGKPLMLGEFGADSADPALKASVFATFAAQARELPAIKAYVFFDHMLDSTTHGNNWAYDDDPTVLAAARAAFSDPYFRQG